MEQQIGETSNLPKLEKVSDLELAKESNERYFVQLQFANERQNSAADKFTALETQIGAIAIALTATLIASDSDLLNTAFFKFGYLIGLVLLVGSLVFGIVMTHHNQNFWGRMAKALNDCSRKYTNVREGKITLPEAKQFVEGRLPPYSHQSSTKWPWVTQTILLLSGIVWTLTILGIGVFK